MSDAAAEALRAGAARGLLDVLRARRPDLAWEITPLDADQPGTMVAGPAEVRRLIAPRDELHPPQATALPDPDDSKSAA